MIIKRTDYEITKSMIQKVRLVESESFQSPNRNEENTKDDKNNTAEEQYRKFLVDGGVVQISGIDSTELEVSDTEKDAYRNSKQTFIDNISDMVEFKILNISTENIEWVGELTQENLEWVYSLDDQNGCYITGNMLQLTDDALETISNLRRNYKEWVSVWGRVLSDRRNNRRKKTINDN